MNTTSEDDELPEWGKLRVTIRNELRQEQRKRAGL